MHPLEKGENYETVVPLRKGVPKPGNEEHTSFEDGQVAWVESADQCHDIPWKATGSVTEMFGLKMGCWSWACKDETLGARNVSSHYEVLRKLKPGEVKSGRVKCKPSLRFAELSEGRTSDGPT